jgi:hypothetical protein
MESGAVFEANETEHVHLTSTIQSKQTSELTEAAPCTSEGRRYCCKPKSTAICCDKPSE